MRRRKANPLKVTSFRLPDDVHVFLRQQAASQDRTMTWILVEILKQYMNYLSEQAKQPKVVKK